MVKRKTSVFKQKPKDNTNKKALIWVGASLGVLIILLAILIVFNNA